MGGLGIHHSNLYYIYLTGWWFGTWFFPYIGNVIIPTDFHIFQRGWNHQPDYIYVHIIYIYILYIYTCIYIYIIYICIFYTYRGGLAGLANAFEARHTHTHAGFPSNKRRGLKTASGEANWCDTGAGVTSKSEFDINSDKWACPKMEIPQSKDIHNQSCRKFKIMTLEIMGYGHHWIDDQQYDILDMFWK